MNHPIHVAVDARVSPGPFGGVAELAICYVKALAALDPEEFRFTILGDARHDNAWLQALLPPNATLAITSDADFDVRQLEGRLARNPLSEALLGIRSDVGALPVGVRDGTRLLRRLGVDVLHLLFQFGFVTELPYIYHPHDLQHVHLPANFSISELKNREILYQILSRSAEAVTTASRWTTEDVIRSYAIPAERVHTIPLAPTSLAEPATDPGAIKSVMGRLGLVPDGYAVLPAQTWPHKNHAAVLQAMATLKRTRGLAMKLVCTGALNEHAPALMQQAASLGLAPDVQFLGYVSREDLSVLYQLARFAVIPTKFEAGSFPMWDAFRLRCPVACSNVASLPSQAGGGACLFDPNDVEEITRVLEQMWLNAALRADLVEAGARAVQPYSWDLTVRRFAVLYRKLAGASPSAEDLALLTGPPSF